jgi:hypothetical protein
MNKYKGVIVFVVMVAIYLALFIGVVAFFGSAVTPAEWMQIILTTALVIVTIIYTLETRNQALASLQTVEEMKKQTVIQSRPLIIQKAVHHVPKPFGYDDVIVITSNSFSHFQIMNAGNGPAIELEISLLDNDRNTIYSQRETYLKPGEEIIFGDAKLVNQLAPKYLVCQYRLIFSTQKEKMWQQTWLPLEVTKGNHGQVYLAPGELRFCEIIEKDRINPFANKPV